MFTISNWAMIVFTIKSKCGKENSQKHASKDSYFYSLEQVSYINSGDNPYSQLLRTCQCIWVQSGALGSHNIYKV